MLDYQVTPERLAPLLPLFLFWMGYTERILRSNAIKAAKIYSRLLAVIIGLNGLIVAFVHIKWETVSSITLRTQLENLSNGKRPVEVDYGRFKRSIEEKLDHWDIKFTAVPLNKRVS